MERMGTKYVERVDTNSEVRTIPEVAVEQRTPASIALELGALSMRFARVERIPRYEDGRRESDVEHSFMLSMVATEIAHLLYPDLDIGLVGEYAKVHDLIEIIVGDVATFALSPEELAEKEAAEHTALEDLLADLPPYTAGLLRRYESQKDRESRFVRCVDKHLAVVVDILGQGKRVMEEDYGITLQAELHASQDTLHRRIASRFSEFEELISAHKQLCELFEDEYS